MLGIKDVNRYPVVHTWSYNSPRLPNMIRNQRNADLVMTSAPLAMKMCGLAPQRFQFAIQWHIVAMYGPRASSRAR